MFPCNSPLRIMRIRRGLCDLERAMNAQSHIRQTRRGPIDG